MALNTKSNSKPAAKKAVVGKSKKKTVWWKKVFIGSSVAVLMLSVGFSGYTWWQDRQFRAAAENWSAVWNYDSTLRIHACKYYSSVKYYVNNQSRSWATIKRNGAVIAYLAPYSRTGAGVTNFGTNIAVSNGGAYPINWVFSTYSMGNC